MDPMGPILYVHIDSPCLSSAGVIDNTGPIRIFGTKTDINGTIPEEIIIFRIAIIFHGKNIAGKFNIMVPGISLCIVHAKIDSAAKGCKGIETPISFSWNFYGTASNGNSIIQRIFAVYFIICIGHHAITFNGEIYVSINGNRAPAFTAEINTGRCPAVSFVIAIPTIFRRTTDSPVLIFGSIIAATAGDKISINGDGCLCPCPRAKMAHIDTCYHIVSATDFHVYVGIYGEIRTTVNHHGLGTHHAGIEHRQIQLACINNCFNVLVTIHPQWCYVIHIFVGCYINHSFTEVILKVLLIVIHHGYIAIIIPVIMLVGKIDGPFPVDNRNVIIITLTGSLCTGGTIGEGDWAALQRYGGSSKAICDFYGACQMFIGIVGIEQFLCQLVQYFVHFVYGLGAVCITESIGETGTVCHKGNCRTLCRIGDTEAAATDPGGIRRIMLVNDLRIAAVVIYRNIISIVLVDNACIGSTVAAHQFRQVAAGIGGCPPCTGLHGSPFFIVPGRPVLQEQVDGSGEYLASGYFSGFREFIIGYPGPFGIFRSQAKINYGMKFRFTGIYSSCGCCDIPFQYQFIGPCTGGIIVIIQVHVHAGGAAFGNHRIVVMGIVFIDFNIPAAIDRQLCSTAVGKEGIAINLCIHIAVDGDLRPHLEGIVAAAVYKGYAIITPGSLL